MKTKSTRTCAHYGGVKGVEHECSSHIAMPITLNMSDPFMRVFHVTAVIEHYTRSRP